MKSLIVGFFTDGKYKPPRIRIRDPSATCCCTGDCSDPEDYDENHLIQRCYDGAYLIDKETGEKSWTAQNELGGKACSKTETGMDVCVLVP